MKRISTAVVVALGLSAPLLLQAQGAPPQAGGRSDVNNSLVSETEVHVVRGLLERANTSAGFARIALTRSTSPAVKQAAQDYIDGIGKVSADLRSAGTALKIEGISGGPPPGGAPPGGGPGGGGSPPGGGGPGGPGGGMARSGPGVYAARFTDELNSVPTDKFDELFELRTLEYLEDMQRTLLSESVSGETPALRDWVKANAQAYIAQGRAFARLAFGESGGPGGPGGRSPPPAAASK